MLCNGNAPALIKDFLQTGEKLLPPIGNIVKVTFASPPVRFLIDSILRLTNKGRQYTNLLHAHNLTPEKFELVLKERM